MEIPMATLLDRAIHTTNLIRNPRTTKYEKVKVTVLYIGFEVLDLILNKICHQLNTFEAIINFRDEIEDHKNIY